MEDEIAHYPENLSIAAHSRSVKYRGSAIIQNLPILIEVKSSIFFTHYFSLSTNLGRGDGEYTGYYNGCQFKLR